MLVRGESNALTHGAIDLSEGKEDTTARLDETQIVETDLRRVYGILAGQALKVVVNTALAVILVRIEAAAAGACGFLRWVARVLGHKAVGSMQMKQIAVGGGGAGGNLQLVLPAAVPLGVTGMRPAVLALVCRRRARGGLARDAVHIFGMARGQRRRGGRVVVGLLGLGQPEGRKGRDASGEWLGLGICCWQGLVEGHTAGQGLGHLFTVWHAFWLFGFFSVRVSQRVRQSESAARQQRGSPSQQRGRPSQQRGSPSVSRVSE